VHFEDCTFSQCTSSQGGGVYVFRAHQQTSFRGCTFTECSAGGAGGALRFWDQNTDTVIDNVRVSRSVASEGGGIAFEEVSGGAQQKPSHARPSFTGHFLLASLAQRLPHSSILMFIF
jgi:hypothetical protein